MQGTLDSGETSTRSENTIPGKCPKVTFQDFGMVWNVERSHMPKAAVQDSGEILNVERSPNPQKLCLDSRTIPNVNRGRSSPKETFRIPGDISTWNAAKESQRLFSTLDALWTWNAAANSPEVTFPKSGAIWTCNTTSKSERLPSMDCGERRYQVWGEMRRDPRFRGDKHRRDRWHMIKNEWTMTAFYTARSIDKSIYCIDQRKLNYSPKWMNLFPIYFQNK